MAAPVRTPRSAAGGLAPAFAAVRVRVGLVALLVVLAGVAWWWTARQMQGMDEGPWTGLGTLGWFLGVWVVMMAAMMFPSVAWSSTNMPSFQLPSVMTFGVSAMPTTRRPPTSVPSTCPSWMSNARTTRQKS